MTAAVPLPPSNRKSLQPRRRRLPMRRSTSRRSHTSRAAFRLTPSQQQYWPAVEAALRDVLRQQRRPHPGAPRSAANIDTNSPEVQRLTWAAMPLLMQLRENQSTKCASLPAPSASTRSHRRSDPGSRDVTRHISSLARCVQHGAESEMRGANIDFLGDGAFSGSAVEFGALVKDARGKNRGSPSARTARP